MSLKKNVRVISLFCHMWYFLSLLGKKYWMVLFYYLKYKFWLIQLCTCSFYQFFVLFSLKFLVHYRSALLVQSIFLDLGGFSSKSKPSFSGIRQVRFAQCPKTEKNRTIGFTKLFWPKLTENREKIKENTILMILNLLEFVSLGRLKLRPPPEQAYCIFRAYDSS